MGIFSNIFGKRPKTAEHSPGHAQEVSSKQQAKQDTDLKNKEWEGKYKSFHKSLDLYKKELKKYEKFVRDNNLSSVNTGSAYNSAAKQKRALDRTRKQLESLKTEANNNATDRYRKYQQVPRA